MGRQQDELEQRQATLLPLITELHQQPVDLAQQIAAVSRSVAELSNVVETTQTKVVDIYEVVERLGPSIGSALISVRNDLLAEITQARRTQGVLMVVILTVLVLAWATLEGVVPGV